jgi:hypothetical protein
MNPIRANATDINNWADRREAQAMLPRLIRRLVLASIKRAERIHFRSEEGVQLGGWDGIVQVPEGNAFVPDGISAWELSAERGIETKANNDYNTRSADPRGLDPASTFFIYATPRKWSGRRGDANEAWAAEKRNEGVWRGVRAYDASDLDTWLEQTPAVDIWFSITIGKRPIGAIDLNSFWNDWSKTTRPPLNTGIVIAGREGDIARISQWLCSEPSVLGLQADTWDEAIAYFFASLFGLPEEERERALARAIVVEDVAAWRQFALCDNSLILIPVFTDRSKVVAAIEKGHHILFPLNRSEPSIGNPLQISQLGRVEAEKALIAMGVKEADSRDLASLARLSLGALQRKLAIFPDALAPEWSKQPDMARSLLPAVLAGRWDEENEGDQGAIARLAGGDYSDVREILISWNKRSDPPLRLVQQTWLIAAREDAWRLLGSYLNDDILRRFDTTVLEVLSEEDPQFELQESERWLANVHGRKPKYSHYLRDGLAESLALMATLSDMRSLSTRSGQEWANGIVIGLFNRITDWKLWASLSPFLPLLAEASPEIFLRTVENDLSTSNPNLVHLFSDNEYHFLQSSLHTGLLRALEVLAWPSEYLSESALLLAKLARLVPAGKPANQIINSLHRIFLLWRPCTTANLERRLRILDIIRQNEPLVAWDLMINLIPRANDVTYSTSKPKYRNWLPEEETSLPLIDIASAVTEIIQRLLEDAGTDGQRWRALIKKLDSITKIEFDNITGSLLAMNMEDIPQPDSLQIWEGLRDLLSRHLQSPDAKWVLSQPCIERIRQCCMKFEPRDPVLKQCWLFSNHPSFPEGGSLFGREREDMINQARVRAINEIFATGGLPMLLELANKAENTYYFGRALAQSIVFDEREALLLAGKFGSNEKDRRGTFAGLLNGGFVAKGMEWLEGLKSSEIWSRWSPRQRADYYIYLPFVRSTWDALEREEPEIQRSYWLEIGMNGRGELEQVDCEYITSKLTEYGRLGTAVDFMALYKEKLCHSPILIAEILNRAINRRYTEKVDWNPLANEVAELLDILEASGEIEESQIAQFELYFLPLLQSYGRSPKILHKALAEFPEFFVEVLQPLYRAEGEKTTEMTEEQKVYANMSFDLLLNWKQPPGINEDGSVNPEKLRSWVGRARKLAQANGRGDVADNHIGQVLAHYPADAVGVWPHEALRELLEYQRSEGIENGIINGIYNNRGVMSRSISEGGDQERDIAERYRGYAGVLSDNWPRTALLLRKIAEIYESEARWEDGRAELIEDLMR